MRQIDNWSDIPGLTIDEIININDARLEYLTKIKFEEDDKFVEIATVDRENICLEFYDLQRNQIDPQTLKGKKVTRIIVPFLEYGERGDSGITFVLDRTERVVLAPEDWGTPLRIT